MSVRLGFMLLMMLEGAAMPLVMAVSLPRGKWKKRIIAGSVFLILTVVLMKVRNMW